MTYSGPAEWLEYESTYFRVWGHRSGDLIVEKTTTGESVYVQGSEAIRLLDRIEATQTHWAEKNVDPTVQVDHELWEYFTDREVKKNG